MNIGFIGFGEAAFEMASGLKEEGLNGFKVFDLVWNHPSYGEIVQERMKIVDASLCEQPGEVLESSDVVIVAVPADKAYEVSEMLYPDLKSDTLYIDVSASTPQIKYEISKLIEKKQAIFIDAAMMGPLPIYKHKVPILASGSGADLFKNRFSPYHMNITKVGNKGGDASAVKLVRSVFMKGLAQLFIETLGAAKHFGVEKLVVKSINETMNNNSFEKMMNRLVTGTAIHSERRGIELQGSIDMLASGNLDASMSKAAKVKLDKITELKLKEKFNGQVPDTWEEVIEVLNETLEDSVVSP